MWPLSLAFIVFSEGLCVCYSGAKSLQVLTRRSTRSYNVHVWPWLVSLISLEFSHQSKLPQKSSKYCGLRRKRCLLGDCPVYATKSFVSTEHFCFSTCWRPRRKARRSCRGVPFVSRDCLRRYSLSLLAETEFHSAHTAPWAVQLAHDASIGWTQGAVGRRRRRQPRFCNWFINLSWERICFTSTLRIVSSWYIDSICEQPPCGMPPLKRALETAYVGGSTQSKPFLYFSLEVPPTQVWMSTYTLPRSK